MTERFQSFEIYKVMKQVLDKKANRLLNVDECTKLLNNLNEENKQLKEQIKIYEKFLDGNDLDIEWDLFCTADVCHEEEDTECKDCKYMRWTE